MPTRTLAALTEFERDVMIHRLTASLKAREIELKIPTGRDKVIAHGQQSHFKHLLAYRQHILASCGSQNKKKPGLKGQLGALYNLKKQKREDPIAWPCFARPLCLKIKKNGQGCFDYPIQEPGYGVEVKGITLPRSSGAFIQKLLK